MCLTASGITAGSVGQIAKNPDSLDALDQKVIEWHALGWRRVPIKVSSGREQGATEHANGRDAR